MQTKEKNTQDKSAEQLFNELKEGLKTETYDNSRENIEKLSHCKDTMIRLQLATVLSTQNNNHAERVLIQLLHDKSYLVQVEAIDSLFRFDSYQIIKEIWTCLDSIHPLVRGYAYRYICFSCHLHDQEVKERLCVIKEKNTWARIMLFIGLLQRGCTEKIVLLLSMYYRCSYINKCAILNGLCDIYDDCSDVVRTTISIFLQRHRQIRKSVAENEAFIRLYKMCFE